MPSEILRYRGRVQGVGFRPTVARIARALHLDGWVRNDANGVEVALVGPQALLDRFVTTMVAERPPLAVVDAFERTSMSNLDIAPGFAIMESQAGPPTSGLTPDAATCRDCQAEVNDPYQRRYRYPFTSCTHCGPRYTILESIPYDRSTTTMRGFLMCDECQAEYRDPTDRRYHAQPLACHACGPQAELVRTDGRASTFEAFSMLDEVDAAGSLLARGEILALKGLGGYQLCCDATHERAVARLRDAKHREEKPFALMVLDLDAAEAIAHINDDERQLLQSAERPIVLLDRKFESLRFPIAANVAPGSTSLGIMLPTTPLHQLMLKRIRRPIVCTSGNRSDEPQWIDDTIAQQQLPGLADWILRHNRPIAHRMDDSIVRWMAGAPRVLRRARGYAPAMLSAPPGFTAGTSVLAVGGQYKATFALGWSGHIVLSPHLGDLDALPAFEAWQRQLDALTEIYDHRPHTVAIDAHPHYRTAELGRRLARARGLNVIEVYHHHAHIAACLAENHYPNDGPPVLGIALDGLGWGLDHALWGGEFLIADYRGFHRYGTFKPVALLGGDAASREPWRNLYAHLMAEIGWAELEVHHGDTALVEDFRQRPRALLDSMLKSGTQAPLASSAGRLFDAVAAALGLHRERITFEGQAAMALEALVTRDALETAMHEDHYPVAIPKLAHGSDSGLPYIEWKGLWTAILGDLWAHTPPPIIAARFHVAVVDAIAMMADHAHRAGAFDRHIALSGGVWQNRWLLELASQALTSHGYIVLTHRVIPPNDACIAFGQAAIAACSTPDD